MVSPPKNIILLVAVQSRVNVQNLSLSALPRRIAVFWGTVATVERNWVYLVWRILRFRVIILQIWHLLIFCGFSIRLLKRQYIILINWSRNPGHTVVLLILLAAIQNFWASLIHRSKWLQVIRDLFVSEHFPVPSRVYRDQKMSVTVILEGKIDIFWL